MKKIALVLAVMFMFLGSAYAGNVDFNLIWDAPTTNEDGTLLTDLAGYKVYWSSTSGNYNSDDSVGVSAPTQTATISLQESQTWYFVVTALDDSGNESEYSDEVSDSFVNPPKGCTNLRFQ